VKCPAAGKSIRCNVLDGEIDKFIRALTLKPSWKERMMAELASQSEYDTITKERKQIEDKLRRLARAYVDGLIEERDCRLQQKLLEDRLEYLVIPQEDETLEAGKPLENLS